VGVPRVGRVATRAEHHLIPLKRHPALDAVARAHASDMARRNYLSHDNPEGANAVGRLHADGVEGFTLAAENIGRTNESPPNGRILESWMASPTHRVNLLTAAFNTTGLGIVRARVLIHAGLRHVSALGRGRSTRARCGGQRRALACAANRGVCAASASSAWFSAERQAAGGSTKSTPVPCVSFHVVLQGCRTPGCALPSSELLSHADAAARRRGPRDRGGSGARP
jgi:hypothetical protein